MNTPNNKRRRESQEKIEKVFATIYNNIKLHYIHKITTW